MDIQRRDRKQRSSQNQGQRQRGKTPSRTPVAQGALAAKSRSRSTSRSRPRSSRSAKSSRPPFPTSGRTIWPTINPSGSCDVLARVHVAPGGPNRTQIRSSLVPRSTAALVDHALAAAGHRSRRHLRAADGRRAWPVRLRQRRGHDEPRELQLPRVSRQVLERNRSSAEKRSVRSERARRLARGNPVRPRSPQEDAPLDGAVRSPPRRRRAVSCLEAISKSAGQVTQRDLAWCRWKNTKVIFNDNAIRTAIPVEHIQGQLENVSGWSNGMALEVEGIMKLESVSFMGQQITQLESPFHVQGRPRNARQHPRSLPGRRGARRRRLLDQPGRNPALPCRALAQGRPARGIRTHDLRPPILPRLDRRTDRNRRIGQRRAQHPRPRRSPHPRRETWASCRRCLRLASVINSVPSITVASREKNRTQGKTAFDSADVNFSDRQRHRPRSTRSSSPAMPSV